MILSVDEQLQILTGVSLVKRSSCENFLGAKFNANLHFNDHVKIIHSKASNKLRASRIAYMSREERKCPVKYFLVHNSTAVN